MKLSKERKKEIWFILHFKFICAEADAFGEAEAGGSPYMAEK